MSDLIRANEMVIKGDAMGIINEKVLAVTVIAVLYALTWLMKSQTALKAVINILLGIVTIIWVLDFFGIYSYTNFLPKQLLIIN